MVFLDENNIYNSMGLINEIIFKGLIIGKQLKENTTFIAVCKYYKECLINIIKEILKSWLKKFYKNNFLNIELIWEIF